MFNQHQNIALSQIAVSGATLAIGIFTGVSPVYSQLIQQDLFFGRNISGAGEVSEEQFQNFLDTVITPRFPNGLTVYDGDGQYLSNFGVLIKEPSKIVTLLSENTPENQNLINEIAQNYNQQFNQEEILVRTNLDITISFDVNDDLIDNDLIPEFIATNLFFGRNISGGGQVSEAQFQTFIDTVITPLFPAGLTVFDAYGQFLDSTGILIQEPSKVVSLFLEDTQSNESAIDEIIETYIDQFNQESVLAIANEDIVVSFDPDDDLINNDLIPEFIETNLFFGRNISGGGQVSEAQFQTFIDAVITPRFPAGLTVFDAYGQFLDSTGTLIQEPSKVVSLFLEDTQVNESAIDEIILAYLEQFNQESVLASVDEDVIVTFNASTASIPEPNIELGLLTLGILGLGCVIKGKIS